jgi:pimeloyl-ACP methyl ester carboxylesterase
MFEIPTATRPPQTTRSADGTTIAYDVHGDASTGAPVVVCVGGATNTRLEWSAFCEALADRGLVGVTYDRRGRGDSSDTAPYAVAREVEDLTAVVEAVRAGGRAVAIGFSSGAALVLQAAAAGAPLERAVIMEPPYRIEGSPPLPDAYCDTLEAMIAEGRNDDAFEYFQVRAVGLPQEMVDGMKGTEMWAYFARTAPTLSYDGHCLGGNVQAFPTELVAGIEAPILALASTGSPPFLQGPARMVGETAPNARFELLEGEFHSVPDDVLADAVAGFAREA